MKATHFCWLALSGVLLITSPGHSRIYRKDPDSLPVTNLIAADSHLDISYFHKTDALLNELETLTSKCNWMSFERMQDSDDKNFDLPVITIHKENPSYAGKHKTILLNFGAHGRELISSEIALRLISTLCSSQPTVHGLPMNDLLEKISWKIVPVQNIAARRQAEAQKGTCTSRRKNARNVDLNRNWNVSWAHGEYESSAETYHGPSAFSESETRIVSGIAKHQTPDVFVDVHAGDYYLGMPYCHQSQWPAADTKEPMIAMLSHLRSTVFNGSIQFGPCSTQGEEPYISTGTAVDYMFEVAKAKYSFVFETWLASKLGGAAATHQLSSSSSMLEVADDVIGATLNLVQDSPVDPGVASPPLEGVAAPRNENDLDCFSYFNPDRADRYEWTVTTWTKAMLHMGDFLLRDEKKKD